MSEFARKKEVLKTLVQHPFEKRNKNQAHIQRRKYAEYIKRYDVKNNYVLYEAYHGRGMLGNPYAIFEAFKKRPDFKQYTHIWTLESPEENEALINCYKDCKNVIFVKRNSELYLKYLACSKYLINNVTFHFFFMKREEQVYVNTWHGIPIKNLGYDIPNGAYEVGNILKNFLACDYLISPNDYMTDIYLKSYRLDGIYRNNILLEGMPRNDFYYHTDRDWMINHLRSSGVDVDENKKIIVYAPTFRGAYSRAVNRLQEYVNFIDYINSKIDTEEYQVFIKPHQAEFKVLKDVEVMKGKLIPVNIDANQLLKITDILVSDYSSIFFDYLISERPILFYIPDLEKYKNGRGVCFDMSEFPGPQTKSLEQLTDWINNIDEVHKQYLPRIQEMKTQYCPYDDGKASEKLLDVILDGKKDYKILNGYDKKKTKLLFYIGTLRTNGVTVSLMSLLNLLDKEKYDISVYFIANKDKNSIFDTNSFHEAVRLIPRVSTYNATTKEEFYHGMINQFGLTKKVCEKVYPQEMYEREFTRSFGDTEFDYIIDFSGYGSFIPRMLLGDKHAKKLIWQHNNLPRDRKRVVNGKRPFETELKVVFSLYKLFDKVVGCSRNVMEINRQELATDETYDKFSYAKNSIHAERILKGIEATQILERDGKEYLILDEVDSHDVVNVGRMVEVPNKKYINFCTTGRMSEEKNQMNLLKAFAKLYKENQNCRLYLIGDGPLREQLVSYAKKNNVEEGVIFTGNIANPFQLVKRCDCFVLPSKWEGQALVALETRVVDIPLIISRHPGYEAVCIENGQYVTDVTVDSIYEGLQAFVEGRVPSVKCDYDKYNEEAVREFESLLD